MVTSELRLGDTWVFSDCDDAVSYTLVSRQDGGKCRVMAIDRNGKVRVWDVKWMGANRMGPLTLIRLD